MVAWGIGRADMRKPDLVARRHGADKKTPLGAGLLFSVWGGLGHSKIIRHSIINNPPALMVRSVIDLTFSGS